MKIIYSIVTIVSLLAGCKTSSNDGLATESDKELYPQPFDPEFNLSKITEGRHGLKATEFDRKLAQKLLFENDHKTIYAEPITAQLAAQYPHLTPMIGQLVLGSNSLHFVIAGVTTTQQAKGMLPLLSNVYYRTAQGWHASAAAGQIDWKVGRSKDTIWPIIGIDADHSANYGALSLIASPSIKSQQRVKTVAVFVPEFQTVYFASKLVNPSNQPSQTLIAIRQHSYSGGTAISEGEHKLTISRMINDDSSILQAWPSEAQHRTDDSFFAAELSQNNASFIWSMAWGIDSLRAGVQHDVSRKNCIESQVTAFFAEDADHDRNVDLLKSCLKSELPKILTIKAEGEELGYPAPRHLQLRSASQENGISLNVPLNPDQEVQWPTQADALWEWRDGSKDSAWQPISQPLVTLPKRPGGLVRIAKSSPPTLVQLAPTTGGEFIDVGRALQSILEQGSRPSKGSLLYLGQDLQFHLPFGSYEGRMISVRGKKECPVSFSLDNDRPDIHLECILEPEKAIATNDTPPTLVTVDLSTRQAEKIDLLKLASHGVNFYTHNVAEVIPEQVSEEILLAIAVTDPLTQLSARLFPLSIDEIKRWRNLKQQRGNMLLNLTDFQRSLSGKTWLTVACPTSYIDQEILLHWLKQLTPQALEIDTCNSTASKHSASLAVFQYLATSTQNLYLIGHSGIASTQKIASGIPTFVHAFGEGVKDQAQAWEAIYQGQYYQSSFGIWRSILPKVKSLNSKTDELTFTLDPALKDFSVDYLKFELATEGGALNPVSVTSQDKQLFVTFRLPKQTRFGHLQWRNQSAQDVALSIGIPVSGSSNTAISGQFAMVDFNKLREKSGR